MSRKSDYCKSQEKEVREIINKLRERWVIKNNYKRLVTLSPLTPMTSFSY